MLVLECSQIVDILVDDDIEIIWLVVCRYISGSESLSHLVCLSCSCWLLLVWCIEGYGIVQSVVSLSASSELIN